MWIIYIIAGLGAGVVTGLAGLSAAVNIREEGKRLYKECA